VWIVRQNFEYHYEEEFDVGTPERMNEEGEPFAVVYAHDGGVVGQGAESLTLNEAITIAEHAIPQGIKWDDNRLQPLFGGRQYRLEESPVTDT